MKGRVQRPAALGVAAASFLLGLVWAFWVARVTEPAGAFPKYYRVAEMSDEELGVRVGDYSPLYLAATRALHGEGRWPALRRMLRLQGVLHAATAAAVALAVAALAGPWWAAR